MDDTKEELPELEQLVFPIQHRKAAAVADQLKDIIKKMTEKQGRTGARAEIQIIPNSADNSIMVLAPETQRDKIRRLIETIDVEPVKGWSELKLTLFPLLHSKAAEMATVITDLLQTQQDREAAEEVIHRLQISKALPDGEIVELPPIDLQKPTRIIADDGTNSLIVATVEENVGPLGELIRLMDVVPMAEALTMKLFPLRFADAQALRDLLQDMMDKGPPLTEDPDGSGAQAVPADDTGKALVYKVQLFADVRTQTLIVTGRAEHLALIEQMIGELDRPASALKFPLRFITLDRTEASRVGEIVTELFDQRFQAAEATEAGSAALERERVFLSTDERSNALIVSASPENFAEIVLIARQLDTEPARLFEQFRILRPPTCARKSTTCGSAKSSCGGKRI
ncbi:MAG: secretin N-terminal domain-containing protein [Dehalococcoidia bacterium]